MKVLKCDRCEAEIDLNSNWGNCTVCGDDLCPECSGGFDDEGACARCHKEPEELVSVCVYELCYHNVQIPKSIFKAKDSEAAQTWLNNSGFQFDSGELEDTYFATMEGERW